MCKACGHAQHVSHALLQALAWLSQVQWMLSKAFPSLADEMPKMDDQASALLADASPKLQLCTVVLQISPAMPLNDRILGFDGCSLRLNMTEVYPYWVCKTGSCARHSPQAQAARLLRAMRAPTWGSRMPRRQGQSRKRRIRTHQAKACKL